MEIAEEKLISQQVRGPRTQRKLRAGSGSSGNLTLWESLKEPDLGVRRIIYFCYPYSCWEQDWGNPHTKLSTVSFFIGVVDSEAGVGWVTNQPWPQMPHPCPQPYFTRYWNGILSPAATDVTQVGWNNMTEPAAGTSDTSVTRTNLTWADYCTPTVIVTILSSSASVALWGMGLLFGFMKRKPLGVYIFNVTIAGYIRNSA